MKTEQSEDKKSKNFHVHLIWGCVCVAISIIALFAYEFSVKQVKIVAEQTASTTIAQVNAAAATTVKLAQATADRALWEAKQAAGALANFLKTAAEKFSTTQITTTFKSELPVFTAATHGRLEVGTAEANEIFRSQDTKMTAWWLNLGTTTTEIKVPVTYRYYVDLSEPWTLSVSEHNCFVEAPPLKPSLPTAIHTNGMEKKSDTGWARSFDSQKLMDDLEKNITPTLDQWATKPEHLDKVRENARLVVARFVRAWLMRENQWKDENLTSVTVRFRGESSSNAILQPTITINQD
jgi:hypothetical protein